MVKPISPDDVKEQKLRDIPERVIECWNKIIARNYTNGYARVDQEDIVSDICSEFCLDEGFTRQDIFRKGWLDIEELYESSGWMVNYDKPGYNESYNAYFEFKKKK